MTIPTDKNAIIVPVPRSLDEGKHVRDAAAFCWLIKDDQFLDENELVLAAANGRIVGVYEMRSWSYVDDVNLGANYIMEEDWHGRVMFDLVPVNEYTWARYYYLPVSKHLMSPKFIKAEELAAA